MYQAIDASAPVGLRPVAGRARLGRTARIAG